MAGPDLLESILDVLLGLPPSSVAVMVAVLAAIENIFPPIPADTAIVAGAYLATTNDFSAWTLFGVTWLGNVSAAVAVYLASRRLGRPFFKGKTGQRLMNPLALNRIERLYARFGVVGIFLSRFIPGIRAVVPPFAGIAGVSAVRAIPPIAAASALWYGTLTYLAVRVVRDLDDVLKIVQGMNRGGMVVGGVLLAVGLGAWWWVRTKRRSP